MYGLDNASGVNVMPKIAPVSSATPLWFTEGGAGLAASYPGQDWFNMIQAELLNVLTAGSVKPEKGKLNQLADAISKIIQKGNYADGNRFKTIPSNVSMSPPEGAISLVLQNDGTLFMWDGAKSIFRISNTGEITTGTMAYSRLTGVPIVQSTGGSTTSFMSQKAVTDMASGLQVKGDYADGKKFKVSSTNSSVLSPNGSISLVLQDDGTLFTWNGASSLFSISPDGKLLKGEIPYARLTGVPLNTLLSEDNGYWRCKDTGFMIQWGRASANGFVNFPIPFPKSLFSFSGVHVGENAIPVRINSERSTLKGIDIAQSTTGQIGMRWIAIGF